MEFFATTGSLPIHISDSKKGDKSIILLHGYLETLYIFEEFSEALQKEGFRVIAIDLPGHGLTGSDPEINSIEFAADLATEVLKICGVEKAYVAGHSMGGYIAQQCIARHPETYEGIILLNSNPYADAPEKKADREREELREQLEKERAELREQTERQLEAARLQIRRELEERQQEETEKRTRELSMVREELDRLDQEFREIVDHAQRKVLIFGDRFPFRYFADAYGLEYYAAFPGCASDTEPSAATMAFLIKKTKEENVPAVLKMELSNDNIANAVAEAAGTDVKVFYSCHNLSAEQFEEGETYLSMMEKNAQTLKEVLN